MTPILAQGLPSAGFIRTFPQALVYGPLKMCRINLPNLFTEKMVAHIHALLKFSNQLQDLTGFLLQATSKAMQLETRLTGQLFEAPLVLADIITNTWMKNMDSDATGKDTPNNRHTRFPTQLTRRQRTGLCIPTTQVQTTTTLHTSQMQDIPQGTLIVRYLHRNWQPTTYWELAQLSPATVQLSLTKHNPTKHSRLDHLGCSASSSV